MFLVGKLLGWVLVGRMGGGWEVGGFKDKDRKVKIWMFYIVWFVSICFIVTYWVFYEDGYLIFYYGNE